MDRKKIIMKNVSYSITEGGRKRKLLNDVNVEFDGEKITVISGPSGSGKTTLLYAMAGLLDKVDGSIYVGGKDINKIGVKEKAEFNEQMSSVARQLNLVVERYPDLKADKMFNNLQQSISEVEENLQAARSNFNSNVGSFNKAILQFPASIVAGSRFTKKEYFEIQPSDHPFPYQKY